MILLWWSARSAEAGTQGGGAWRNLLIFKPLAGRPPTAGSRPAEAHVLKAGLIAQLALIKVQKLTQTAAANRLGVKQPDLSNILRGQVRGYSMERLMHMLAAFDQDIDIVVRPRKHAGKGGRITLMHATG